MRTAISAGALALTLGGALPVVAPVSAGASTWMGDCEGTGLLGGVTGGLCRAVGTVGSAVNGVAGAPSPSPGYTTESAMDGGKDGKDRKNEKDAKNGKGPDNTGGLNDAADKAGRAGKNDLGGPLEITAPPRGPDILATPETGETDGGDDLLPKDFNDVCPPLTGSPECASSSAISTPDETTHPPASPSPRPSHRSRPTPTGDSQTAPLPREPLRPAETHEQHGTGETGKADGGERDKDATSDEVPVIDAEAPRLELLWPAGPVMRKFQRTVTPTRSPDPLGTALTAALLVAAILAVRVLYVRRIGEESMPLEPLRMRRHRTA